MYKGEQFMTVDEIAKKYVETTLAIYTCANNKYYESVWVLFYSAIDSVSWLYSEQMDINKRRVGREYKDWVNKYLLPNLDGYNCTAEELYLARCSVLHTYSSMAKHQGNNRIIVYVYGDKEYENMISKIVNEDETIRKENFVLIHMGDLVNAYSKGMSAFFKQVEIDKKLYDRVIEKTKYYYRAI